MIPLLRAPRPHVTGDAGRASSSISVSAPGRFASPLQESLKKALAPPVPAVFFPIAGPRLLGDLVDFLRIDLRDFAKRSSIAPDKALRTRLAVSRTEASHPVFRPFSPSQMIAIQHTVILGIVQTNGRNTRPCPGPGSFGS